MVLCIRLEIKREMRSSHSSGSDSRLKTKASPPPPCGRYQSLDSSSTPTYLVFEFVDKDLKKYFKFVSVTFFFFKIKTIVSFLNFLKQF